MKKLLTLAALALCVAGCFAPPDPQPSQSTLPDGGVPAPGPGTGPTAGVINGQPLTWAELRDALVEADGGQVLRDIILDRQIARRLAERGMQVTDALIQTEQARFLATLDPDPIKARQALDEVRLRRGLGKSRFQQMLRRNAGLRLLVQDQVHVTDDTLKNQYELAYGMRYKARLILLPSLQAVGDVLKRINAGESFIDVASQSSTDPSAAQGGLLPPISPADAGFPVAAREVLARLKPGEVSDAVPIENQYAILKLEGKIEPSNVKLDDVKAVLTQRIRDQQELRFMNQTARALLAQADDIVLFDPQLDAGWKRQKKVLSE